jgi:hypothetical protein
MTIIQGAISTTGVDSGSTSKGLFSELVDANGRKIAPSECYSAFIDIVPATTLTDGTAYWFMRNTGAKDCLVRRIELNLLFTGTAAASVSSYRFERFATATPTGGTAIVPVKQKNSYSATTITCAFLNTGLTVGGATFESAFWRVGHMNQLAGLATDLDMTDIGEGADLELATGEGLIVRANGALVAGTRMVGAVYWYER